MEKKNKSHSEKKGENKIIIGIDLGTTYSCAAIYRNGSVELIPHNNSGDKKIPSIVCFKDNNERLIGSIANDHMLEYPESTMFDSKRLIGHKFLNKY